MALIYKTGDLVDAEEPILVHGCNARGVMGSGVAKAIRDRYPKAYNDYKTWEETNGLKLGDTIWSQQTDDRWVVNAITQINYGRNGARYVDYDAIKTAFSSIFRSLTTTFEWHADIPTIAIPRIGAGLGGGDWDVISEIIDYAMDPCTVVVYDL